MRLIKDSKIKETIIKYENRIYKRRCVDDTTPMWYISAGVEVNRDEYFWVETPLDKSRDLEILFHLSGLN